MALDLGDQRRLILHRYLLRNDGSGSYTLRNWELQVSFPRQARTNGLFDYASVCCL